MRRTVMAADMNGQQVRQDGTVGLTCTTRCGFVLQNCLRLQGHTSGDGCRFQPMVGTRRGHPGPVRDGASRTLRVEVLASSKRSSSGKQTPHWVLGLQVRHTWTTVSNGV